MHWCTRTIIKASVSQTFIADFAAVASFAARESTARAADDAEIKHRIQHRILGVWSLLRVNYAASKLARKSELRAGRQFRMSKGRCERCECMRSVMVAFAIDYAFTIQAEQGGGYLLRGSAREDDNLRWICVTMLTCGLQRRSWDSAHSCCVPAKA
jgi:hypothetical protein